MFACHCQADEPAECRSLGLLRWLVNQQCVKAFICKSWRQAPFAKTSTCQAEDIKIESLPMCSCWGVRSGFACQSAIRGTYLGCFDQWAVVVPQFLAIRAERGYGLIASRGNLLASLVISSISQTCSGVSCHLYLRVKGWFIALILAIPLNVTEKNAHHLPRLSHSHVCHRVMLLPLTANESRLWSTASSDCASGAGAAAE